MKSPPKRVLCALITRTIVGFRSRAQFIVGRRAVPSTPASNGAWIMLFVELDGPSVATILARRRRREMLLIASLLGRRSARRESR